MVGMPFNGYIFEMMFPVKMTNINLPFLKYIVVWLLIEMPIILFLNNFAYSKFE